MSKDTNCKCKYAVIDGVQVHINADFSKLTDKDMEAINKMVKIVKNYSFMKSLKK